MKNGLLVISISFLLFSCIEQSGKQQVESSKTQPDTVTTVTIIDTIGVIDNKKTEYDYFVDIYKQEKLITADDILMLSITDSLFTSDKDSELFYFVVFTKSMNGSDGFYSEALGLNCFKYITTNPIKLAEYFQSEPKLNENDLKNWANYIYGEIQISRENQEQEAIVELEGLLKEKTKDSKLDNRKLINKLIDKVKTAHNTRS